MSCFRRTARQSGLPRHRVMNDILGGGGFTSHHRTGSAPTRAGYGAGSSSPGVHYPRPFQAGFASKSRTVTYATQIVLERWGASRRRRS